MQRFKNFLHRSIALMRRQFLAATYKRGLTSKKLYKSDIRRGSLDSDPSGEREIRGDRIRVRDLSFGHLEEHCFERGGGAGSERSAPLMAPLMGRWWP